LLNLKVRLLNHLTSTCTLSPDQTQLRLEIGDQDRSWISKRVQVFKHDAQSLTT
jgi:hypothetical protein